MFGFDDLRSLNDLLNLNEQTSDDILDEINVNTAVDRHNPGNIGFKVSQNKTNNSTSHVTNEKSKNPHDIWNEEEIISNEKYIDVLDPRCEPQYKIHFKQNIDTSDVYLQLSNKNPSSASCEYMVIRIDLPKTKYSQITLDVKETFLDLRTPIYKLGLYLPNPVDAESGSAKWNGDKFELEITLKNKRELDFMNF